MKGKDRLSEETRKRLEDVGLQADAQRAGTYIHEDHNSLVSEVDESRQQDIVIMNTLEALETYPWLSDYMWHAVAKDKDEYTRQADEECGGGYFMWVKSGARVDLPIQSCLLIKEKNFKQVVHNIIIVEEGAEVNILTGCLTHPNVHTAEHIGISEFYVKKNAYLNFTMVHDWNEQSFVRPRTGVVVEEGGQYVNNYIVLSKVKDIQTAPVIYLGARSKATLTSLLYGHGSSRMDIGGTAVLNGEDSHAEIVSRSIAVDESALVARGRIAGNTKSGRAHLECQGLLLSDNAQIDAIPELVATKEGADLSHEAAVGKISEEEIIYLMARGLSEEQARSVIVRGFLDVNILGLPEEFEQRTRALVDQIGAGGN